MLQIISWKQYLLYLWFGLIVYYSYIIFRFYRNDLLYLKFPKAIRRKSNTSYQGMQFTDRVNIAPTETTQNPVSATVCDFVDELKVLLKQSVAQQLTKNEIMNAVSKLLKKYPTLKGSYFQTAITNLIAAEGEADCNIRLNADELASLWN